MNTRGYLTRIAFAAITSLIGTGSAQATTKFDCDRPCLKAIADLYFEALAKHDPSLLPLAPTVRYAETGKILKLGEGIWKTAGKPTYRLEIFDPQSGGIGVHAVVPDGDTPTIMALRLKVESRKITEVESILIPKGEKAVFSAPEKLTAVSNYWTRKIRPVEQNNRYELMGVAEGYFRAFETEGTPDYVKTSALPDTLRFENGIQTVNAAMELNGQTLPPTTVAEQFDMAAFKGAIVADRRYPVVDTEVGAVMSMVRFGDPTKPSPPTPGAEGGPYYAAFVSEMFAVTQGKIVEIQAIFIPPTEMLPSPF